MKLILPVTLVVLAAVLIAMGTVHRTRFTATTPDSCGGHLGLISRTRLQG